MNFIAFNGSPRKKSNTSLLLEELLRGAREAGAKAEKILSDEVDLKYCKGCLRCNLLKRCAIKGDDWQELSTKILDADVLVFASPIYFHHLTAPLKKILDRFRSFLHVQLAENGLKHTPWHKWEKQFILILCLGSSDKSDAQPVIDLFEFITSILGPANKLHSIVGTRLAVTNQVKMTKAELATLYPKLTLPSHLVGQDFQRNQLLLKKCYNLGKKLEINKQ